MSTKIIITKSTDCCLFSGDRIGVRRALFAFGQEKGADVGHNDQLPRPLNHEVHNFEISEILDFTIDYSKHRTAHIQKKTNGTYISELTVAVSYCGDSDHQSLQIVYHV